MSPQVQQHDESQEQRRKLLWIVVIVGLIVLIGNFINLILSYSIILPVIVNIFTIIVNLAKYLSIILNPWSNIVNLISIIVTVVSIVLGSRFIVNRLFHARSSSEQPDSSNGPGIPAAASSTSSDPLKNSISASQAPPIPLDSLPTHNLISQDILGPPPPVNLSTIHHRDKDVEKVYALLTNPDTRAVVLTGVDAVGKTILAALVYDYVKEDRTSNVLFDDEPLWLDIDSRITMTYLSGILFDALGKPLPEHFGTLTPRKQALELFNALNTLDKAQLVIMDQFENLLDGQTGHVLADYPGIGEWLDLINSQSCNGQSSRCRLLLTSRLWPRGIHECFPTYMKEYPVKGLNETEGVDLLQKQGLKDAELGEAVVRCDGHPFTLSQLPSLLRDRNMSLSALFNNPIYPHFWMGDIVHNRFDRIARQLDYLQRKLLLAFSVYRETVPLDAAVEVLMGFANQVTETQIRAAFDVLLTQHLLQPSREGYYQVHPVVASYTQSFLIEGDVQTCQQALQAAHARAANYYRREAEKSCPLHKKQQSISDIHSLIEAFWHQCQTEQWTYDLMQKESLFSDTKRWRENTTLPQLYELLLPLTDKQHPGRSQAALIYNDLGKIYHALGLKKQAQKCYKEAFYIFQQTKDLRGEGITLRNFGILYFEQAKVALACFMLARDTFEEIESPNHYEIESCIKRLQKKIGEKQFMKLLTEVKMEASQIVDQICLRRDDK